jgi:protein required for attachment to host cells
MIVEVTMIQDGRTLVVVADGARARLFEEPRRGGKLTERAEWTADLEPPHTSRSSSPGRVYDRAGQAFHGVGSVTPREKQERGFVERVVRRVETLMERERFDNLVLIAPPRALGELRQSLPAAVTRRLRETSAHERLDTPAEELRKILQGLRRENA